MCNKKVILLNTSNMDTFPVYPYAFIQVPAVARQAGVEVICKGLLGISQEMWKKIIQSLIEQHNPAMILITLRNTDSIISQEYEQDEIKETDKIPYFPIERTRELIAIIRSISNLKIVMGGFSFSLLHNELMHHLHPDFGVIGGPNGFFAHFEDIQTGNLEEVPNLLYFLGERLISNPRIFYPPLADTEYTHQSIEEMMAFYTSFSSPGFLGAPVEIMRGCPHSCVFCTEPHVVGRQVRYRDLSAVMGDIEILVKHEITQFHMISSELNPEGNVFVLQLADRIRSFNDLQKEDRKVKWNGANYLLKFSLDEYKRLYQSGFTGGWFDITALDDENARAMQTPYRNKSLLPHLKTYAQAERVQLDLLLTQATSQAKAPEGEQAIDQNDEGIEWTMFLGNPATTIKTIRNTLKIAKREGLTQLFRGCHLNTNIRVFDYEMSDEATLNVTYSVTPGLERTGYQQIFPSFAYPPALLRHFGSEQEITRMFEYIAETYLSTKYQETRDWLDFLRQKTSITSITSWTKELSKKRGYTYQIISNLQKVEKCLQSYSFYLRKNPQKKKWACLKTWQNRSWNHSCLHA